MALVVKTKLFTADNQKPSVPPDGQSLEEQVNSFLATLTPANTLDVTYIPAYTGRFGIVEKHSALVLYKG